jgi:N-acetylneuraminate synthase
VSIKIGDLSVGSGSPPLIVAELSGNHNGSLARALEIVEAVARTGAQAVKLQTYTADTITIDKAGGEFVVNDRESPWHGRTLYSLYREAATPWEWHAQIMGHARELGLACFSTPFDETAVEFLETLDVPAYKIASFENVHLPLIRKAANTGKPLIISTGMASIAEIDDAVRAARDGGCRQLILLKCTSTYPASPLNSNVVTIPHMRELFDCEIGLSDHTMGIGAAVAAVAHGASVIEKHCTLSRAAGGVDSTFSLEPEELRALVMETERAWQSLGHVTYGPSEAEKKSLIFRRSIYVAQDLRAGDALTQDNIRCVRPGLGLAPKYYELLLGRRIKQNVAKGTPLRWELLE